MSLVLDRSRVPDGARLRHITGSIQGARTGSGVGALLLEVWYALVAVAVFVGVVLGVAQTLRLDGEPPTVGLLTGGTVTALAVVTATGAVLSVAGRLGPVGLGGGAAAWWLPLPVDRRQLLRPVVLAAPAVATAAGALAGGSAALLLVGPTAAAVPWALLGGAAGGAVVALAALRQVLTGGRSAGTAAVGDALMTLGAVALALLALVPDGALGAAGGSAPAAPAGRLAAVLAVVAVVAALVAERRSGSIGAGVLRAHGSVGEQVQAAVLSLDVRELARALGRTAGAARYRSRALRPGGPRRVVLVADALLVLRTPRTVVQALVGVLLAIAASRLPVVGTGLGQYAVWLLTGFWAANAVAAGARHADLVPALERLLPLGARTVRMLHAVLPLVAASVWSTVVLGVQAVRAGDPAWLTFAPGVATALAAGTLHAAYRPPFRAPRVVVSSPMGGAPATNGIFRGLDVALVTTLPLALALHLDRPGPVLAAVQAALAVVAAVAVVRDDPHRAKR